MPDPGYSCLVGHARAITDGTYKLVVKQVLKIGTPPFELYEITDVEEATNLCSLLPTEAGVLETELAAYAP